MTRSLSCGLRGMFAESWQYHPMGLPILALIIFTAGQSLLPRIHRERLAGFIRDRAAIFNLFYLAFTGTFVVFGTVRALLHWKDAWPHFGL